MSLISSRPLVQIQPPLLMIDPKCDRCGESMTEFGALYFSPPDKDGRVTKKHICVGCQPLFESLFTHTRVAERQTR